jgi:hypothetical protein
LSLSRRHFLKLAGIALLAPTTTQFAPLTGVLPTPKAAAYEFPAVMGRTLTAAPLYNVPNGTIQRHLFPDTIISLMDSSGDWFHVAGGYVRRTDIQPMQPRHPELIDPQPPFWAEVGASVAVVRQWCAANAPLVTRVGHGGVLYVVDVLDVGGARWYALAHPNGALPLLGWSLAGAWDAVNANPPTILFDRPETSLILNRATRTLTAYEGDRPVLRIAVRVGEGVEAGQARLSIQQMTWQPKTEQAVYYGASWISMFSTLTFYGAYWHNHFGASTPTLPTLDRWSVEVPPAAARWLYQWEDGWTRLTIL